MQRAVIIAGDVVTENDIIIDDASYQFDSLVVENDKSKDVEAMAAPLDYTFLSNDGDSNSEVQTPSLGKELKQQEFQIILDTLKEFNGSRQAVAEKLQISPRTLRYKIAKMREAGYEIP
jgi:DNA-binding NtrC family response regulator